MSTQPNEEKKEEKRLTTEELLAKLAADSYESRRAINAIAEAMVKLKQDVDSLKAGGGGAGGAGAPQADQIGALLKAFGLTSDKKETDLEMVAKSAESLAKLSDSLDRFRVKGYSTSDLLLMRAGYDRLRHPMPRYMTKTELSRYDKWWKELTGEEEEEEGGETEHVPK